jgi:hypothetical protein
VTVFAVVPHPKIDVFDLQTAGAEQLLAGKNPYVSVHVGDTFQAGTVPYVYPPLQIVVTSLVRLLGGDVRFAMLAGLVLAIVGTRQAVRRLAPDASPIVQDLPALLLAVGPTTAFVLEEAWTEPVGLGFIGLAVWAFSARRLTLSAVLWGLAMSSKQSFVFGLPLLLLLPGFSLRHVGIAIAAAVVVIAPFMAWDFGALWRCNVTHYLNLPPRLDGLTFMNMIRFRFGWAPGDFLCVFAAIFALLASWRRSERSASGMLLAYATVLLVFFSTGKQSFVNYYFLVVGIATMAAATRATVSDPRQP